MKSTSLCPLADMLGHPGTGVHSARFMGLARNDILGTLFLAELTHGNGKRWHHILFWFCLGEMLHLMFCVKTPVTLFVHGNVGM